MYGLRIRLYGCAFMTIEINYDKLTSTLTLQLQQDFDYKLADAFKQAYERKAQHYILDMQVVSYLDSSALGMLLSLREYAFAQAAKVSIINMNDVVLEIFRVLNFHKIFKPTYNKEYFRVVWVAAPEIE